MKKPAMAGQAYTGRYALARVNDPVRWGAGAGPKRKKAQPKKQAMTAEEKRRWDDAVRKVYGRGKA